MNIKIMFFILFQIVRAPRTNVARRDPLENGSLLLNFNDYYVVSQIFMEIDFLLRFSARKKYLSEITLPKKNTRLNLNYTYLLKNCG